MKNLIFSMLMIIIACTNFAYAGNSVNSIRTSSGQLVSIGDSYAIMIDKLKQAPISTRSYEIVKNREKYTLYEYIYHIDNSYYTILVKNSHIESISWDSSS